jgi:hypothetical protein
MKKNDIVVLINDPEKGKYIVIEFTGKTSTGPMNQFNPSPIYRVKDCHNRIWEFRKDSLFKFVK